MSAEELARAQLHEHGPAWWRAGHAAAMLDACRSVPADALSQWPDVARWRALAAVMLDAADALACLEQAHAGHRAQGLHDEAVADAHMALVFCLVDVGAMDRVSDWLAHARAGDDPARLDGLWHRLGRLARAVLGGEDVPGADAARAALHALLRPLQAVLSPDERLISAQVLVNHHFVLEQYEQIDFIATLVENPADFDAASALMRSRWCYTFGFALYQLGQHERAQAQWRRALALAESSGLPGVQLMSSLALLRLLLDQGRLDEARRIEASIQPQWGAGRVTQLIELQQMRARLHLLGGQPARALGTLREALALADHSGLSVAERASCLTDLAQVLAAHERLEEAAELLDTLAREHAGRDAEVYRCLHELLQARRLSVSDEPGSRVPLAAGLERAQRLRYTMFFRLLPALAAEICLLALRAGIEPVFAAEVVRARRLPAPPHAGACWPWAVWVRMLGGFELQLNGEAQQRSGKSQQKPLELLRLLACERSLGAGMRAVGEALWPDADEAAARKNLDMTVQRLRRLLGDDGLVRVSAGRVALDPAQAASDVQQRRGAVDRLEALAVNPPADPAAAGAQAAALIVHVVERSLGSLLPGAPPAPWLEAERQRCQREVVRAALAAASLMERCGAASSERELLAAALALEPLSEVLARRLMKLHARNGDLGDAARVYEALRAEWARQDLVPGPETQALERELMRWTTAPR